MINFSGFCILSLIGFSAALPKPCSVKDSECQRQWYIDFRSEFATKGAPELGIPRVDPLDLKEEKLNILKLYELILYNGQAVGIGNCELPYLKADVENNTKTLHIVCNNIVVKGNWELIPSAAVRKSCCYNYSANGNLTVVFGQWNVTIKFPYEYETCDGVKYFKPLYDESEYETSVTRVSTTATGIKFGNTDISECANRWINRNWNLIQSSSIGKRIFDRSEDYFDDIYKLVFSRLPANQIFTDV